MSYKIIRSFSNEEHEPIVIETGLTLEQAKAHCNDKQTSSRTCSTEEGAALTQEKGAWFDIYEEE